MKTTPKTLIATLSALLIGGAAVAQTPSEPVKLDKKSIYQDQGAQVKMQTPDKQSQEKAAVNNSGLSKGSNYTSMDYQHLLNERKRAASRGESTEKYDAIIDEYYQKAKQ